MNLTPSVPPNLTPERLSALRRSIEAGVYNSPEIAEAVARRILTRGDLRGDARDERTVRGSPFLRGGWDEGLIH